MVAFKLVLIVAGLLAGLVLVAAVGVVVVLLAAIVTATRGPAAIEPMKTIERRQNWNGFGPPPLQPLPSKPEPHTETIWR